MQVSERHDHPRVVSTTVVPLTNNTMKAVLVVHREQREENACKRRGSTVRTVDLNAKIEEGTYEHRPCAIIVFVTMGETLLALNRILWPKKYL